jgi:hypothetical protein
MVFMGDKGVASIEATEAIVAVIKKYKNKVKKIMDKHNTLRYN